MPTILKELRLTFALALPMMVGQVSQMLIGLSDNAFIGRVGTVQLAAAAFTHSLFGLFYLVGIGLLLPVAVLTARDHGAGNDAGSAVWLRHGKVLALLSTQLHRFGQPPEVVAVTKPFFLLISASLVPVLYFQVQRQYLDALGRPWVGTSIMLVDIALNALLNWVFIWGHWGAPALGLTGSALATLIARTLAVGMIAGWLRQAPHETNATSHRWEWARMREMLSIGRHVEVTERRTRKDWARCIKGMLEERYPDAIKVRLVMDNLNTHSLASLYETFPPAEARRLAERLEIHYTPKHGSWLNIAEIELSALNSQCLNRRIPDIDRMRTEVASWQTDRNNHGAPVNWRFTTEDARIKLTRLYPKL